MQRRRAVGGNSVYPERSVVINVDNKQIQIDSTPRGDIYHVQRRRHAPHLVKLYETNVFVQAIVGYNHLVREGILQALFCAVALFEGIASLMTYAFELTSLRDILQSRNITGIFLMLEFILAFNFRDTIRDSVLRYHRGPTQYLKLLDCIRAVARYTALSVNLENGVSNEAHTKIAMIFAYVRWANHFTLPVFSEVHRIAPIFMNGPLFHNLTVRLQRNIGDYEGVIDGLMYEISQLAGELKDERVLTSNEEGGILSNVDNVEKILQEIRISKDISAPPMIKLVSLAVIAIFVVIVIPLQCYSQVDIMTPLFYPLIAVVFSSVFLFAFYYGEPFSPFTHYKAMDFEGWRDDNTRTILNYERVANEPKETRKLLIRNYGEDGSVLNL